MTTRTHPVTRAAVEAAQAAYDRGPARPAADRMRTAVEAALAALLPGIRVEGDAVLRPGLTPTGYPADEVLLRRHAAPDLFDALAAVLPEVRS